MASIVNAKAAKQTDEPLPHPTKEQIDNCQFHKWYNLHQNIKKCTIRSIILPMSTNFIQYLNEDGIKLPNVPDGETVSPFDPRYEKPIASDDEWNDYEGEEEEDDSSFIHCFPEFEKNICAAIKKLGGKVFVKTNWSSPRDAKWVSGTLECQTPGEIYLLLKSSDFISYDLAHAYDLVQQQKVDDNAINSSKVGESVMDDNTSKTKVAENGVTELSNNNSKVKQDNFYLVLRKWGNLYPSQEFRCFVKQNKLVMTSQRDPTKFYPFLVKQKNAYKQLVESFFNENILNVYPDDDYSFDIYIDRKNRVWLLDFNVYSRATDALLFTWDEILNVNVTNNSSRNDDNNEEYQRHEFRIVEDESQVRISQLTMHKVPAEFVNNPKNFIEEFVDKYRNGEIDNIED
jgi:hypothetical protein